MKEERGKLRIKSREWRVKTNIVERREESGVWREENGERIEDRGEKREERGEWRVEYGDKRND